MMNIEDSCAGLSFRFIFSTALYATGRPENSYGGAIERAIFSGTKIGSSLRASFNLEQSQNVLPADLSQKRPERKGFSQSNHEFCR